MYSWQAFVMRKLPSRCTASTFWKSCSGILNRRLSRMMPALLTKTVGGPSSSAVFFTAACTCSSSDTSAPMPMASPPAALIASTVSRVSSSFRSNTATLCPSAARRFAVAAPIPRAAPVTIAVRAIDHSSWWFCVFAENLVRFLFYRSVRTFRKRCPQGRKGRWDAHGPTGPFCRG